MLKNNNMKFWEGLFIGIVSGLLTAYIMKYNFLGIHEEFILGIIFFFIIFIILLYWAVRLVKKFE